MRKLIMILALLLTATTFHNKRAETFIDIVKEYSLEYKLDYTIVLALIDWESSFDQYAKRRESHLKKTDWYNYRLTKIDKTNLMAYYSIGYMQILPGVARYNGYKGKIKELFHARTNIKYGCKHLSQLKSWWIYDHHYVAAYNYGWPKRIDGHYVNKNYVDTIMIKWAYYKKLEMEGKL